MRNIKRRLALTFTAIGVVTVGSAFAYHNLSSETASVHSTESVPTESQAGKDGRLLVRGFTVRESLSDEGTRTAFTGTLQPRYVAQVGFRVSGKISERLVELGEKVAAGQVLFKLDSVDADLQLRVAESDHASAESLYKQTKAEEARMTDLLQSKSVSRSEYELALAARDVAQARLNAAERRLSLARNQRQYCELVADSAGLITSITAEAGQVVNVGQPVLQMMQGDELEVAVSIPESLVSNAKKLDASVSFWSLRGPVVKAQLREMSPIADPVSRTYDARFRLNEAVPDVSIGMTATVHLSNAASNGILIPLTAIANRGETPAVWRVKSADGAVELVDVEIIQYRSDSAVVRASLNPGDTIVSAGVQRIDPSTLVRIWKK